MINQAKFNFAEQHRCQGRVPVFPLLDQFPDLLEVAEHGFVLTTSIKFTLYNLMGYAVAHINGKLLYFGLPISVLPLLNKSAWVKKFKRTMYQLKFDDVLFLQDYQIERNS